MCTCVCVWVGGWVGVCLRDSSSHAAHTKTEKLVMIPLTDMLATTDPAAQSECHDGSH